MTLVQEACQMMNQCWSNRYFKSLVLILLIKLAFGFESIHAQTPAVSAEISRAGDTTHIEFKGLNQWNYDLRPLEDGKVVLKVPAFDMQTLGIFKAWTDSHIKTVEVKTKGPDGAYEVIFQLSGKDVETFDYLTDEPSRLIIDFYKKTEEKPVVSQPSTPLPVETTSPVVAREDISKERKISRTRTISEDYRKVENIQRKPAGSELMADPGSSEVETSTAAVNSPQVGAFDSADPKFDRFRIKKYEIKEDAIIASRQNIYIQFPILKMNSSRLNEILENAPEYIIKPKDEKENKEARLLLKLYQAENKDRSRGRLGAFVKAYDYFIEKYPNSPYDEIVRNVAADAYFKLWRESGDYKIYDKIKGIYNYLQKKYPESALSERNALILSYVDLEREDGVSAIQDFSDFVKRFPNSPEADYAKRAMAEAYLILNKYNDALAVYQDLEKNAKDKVLSIEATYRKGDVEFARSKYADAVKAYKEAIKKFPDFEKIIPNANYNMAESEFWLGQYEDALGHYIRFVELFPLDQQGGYAMTRIGETLEVLGADQSRVMGAFLESYFRYGGSPGARIARLRMISQQMKGMKDKELRKSTEEINEIAETLKLPKIKEFTTLMTTDGLFRRQEYARALDELINYYQENPTSSDLQFFKKKILSNLGEIFRTNIENNKFLEALELNGKYAKTWLKNSNRVDIPYWLAKAYELAGVYKESENIYKSVLKDVEALKARGEEKERRITEHIPSPAVLHLRLASTYLNLRKFSDAFEHLKKITSDEGLSEAERIEKIEMASQIYEERGDLAQAKAFVKTLIDGWRGETTHLPRMYLKLAEYNFKLNLYDEGIDAIDKIEAIQIQGVKLENSLLAKSLELKGDLQLKKGRDLAAVETYMSLLERFEQERPLGSVRYRAGRVLYDRGDLKGAEKIWTQLDESKNGVYKKLAMEKLSHAKWQDEYKRYIDRIPAMTNMKQE